MNPPAVTAELDAPTHEAFVALIDKLAHDKAAMGVRYGEWAVSAPTLESGVAAAAMAQDELGHARSLFPLLNQLGAAAGDEDRMEISSKITILNSPLPRWETFIAVNLVIDTMLANFLAAARESSFSQLAQRARKITQEEQAHRTHAVAWARRLARDADHAGHLSESIDACWSAVADWPGSDESFGWLAAAEIVTGTPAELAAATRATIAEAVADTPLAESWRT